MTVNGLLGELRKLQRRGLGDVEVFQVAISPRGYTIYNPRNNGLEVVSHNMTAQHVNLLPEGHRNSDHDPAPYIFTMEEIAAMKTAVTIAFESTPRGETAESHMADQAFKALGKMRRAKRID